MKIVKKSSGLSRPDFSTYFKEHGSILRSKYPFLTASQIKGKAKDQWKKLPPDEKPAHTPVKPQQSVKTSTPKEKTPGKNKKQAQEVSCSSKKKLLQENGVSSSASPGKKKKQAQDLSCSPKKESIYENDFSSPESCASFEIKFHGIGEMGYASGRKVQTTIAAPDIVHTNPTSTTSILRSSEKNKVHNQNVSFTSPSQWISRSLTESTLTTQSTPKNSGSDDLFNENAMDDSSQDLAYGIGSDESDVDKSNQLNVLHTKALRSKKKTKTKKNDPVKKEKPSKPRVKKVAEKNGAKKGAKKIVGKKVAQKSTKTGSKATGKRKASSQTNTIDRYTKKLKKEADHDSESQSSDEQRADTQELPFLIGSQSSNTLDDNDSDEDKAMMLAQLYVEDTGKKKGRKSQKKTAKNALEFKRAKRKKNPKKSKNDIVKNLEFERAKSKQKPTESENVQEEDFARISFGSPLKKLKEQQEHKSKVNDCFGFDCDSPEPTIVSIVPLRSIQNIAERDAVVINDPIVSPSSIDSGASQKTDTLCTEPEIMLSQDSVDSMPMDKPKGKPVNQRRSRRLSSKELSLSQESEADENAKETVKTRARKPKGVSSEETFKTPNLPGLAAKDLKQKTESVTPQLATDILGKTGKKDEDRTTTPLMPEALVQKTIQKAVASPRKRKRGTKPNQHDHGATGCDGDTARPTKCARKSLIDENAELNQDPLLSPFDKRKQGIPNTDRKPLTPRPKKQRECKRKTDQNTSPVRNSRRTARSLGSLDTAEPTPQAKELRAPKGKRRATSKPKQTRSSSFNDHSSVESVEELEEYSTKPWKAPLLQAAATLQLATKYKELDTFDSIFDNDEEEHEERPARVSTTSGALAEAMKAMREVTNALEEEVESVEVTSDLASSPSQLSVSPVVETTELKFPEVKAKIKRPERETEQKQDQKTKKQQSPECSGDSGKDTAEELDQGDLQPYMKQLQQNVEQSLMDMFDEPKPSTSTNRRNLSSGYTGLEEEEDSSDQQDSGSDFFL